MALSSRRSRDDPDSGIDLGTGFAGFLCHVFVLKVEPTRPYYDDGIEFACELL
jgi:hypothetical protein